MPSILLSVDFEKAFDSLNWNFRYKHFINYVKTMYNGIESTVLNNGNSGKFFKLEHEVGQGSAYLFIISLEILANKVRNYKNIKGIQIDNKEIKIGL